MPADLQALTDCEPMYKTFKGWSGSTTGTTTYKQLPGEAKRYLQYLEDFSECPIDMISTGWKRGYAAVTGSLAVQPFDILHEYASGLHASECPSRFASARFRDEPS